MRIFELNWMMLEQYLEHDDRVAVPLGSTEQHAYLSLGVDAIVSERVAEEAAEPLGVPVLPALPIGVTPRFAAYPGSFSVLLSTYISFLGDVVESLTGQGFRRILFVNGHGGNSPAGTAAAEWMAARPGCQVRFHDWWRGPEASAAMQSIDPLSSHASWMENFPWTRLPDVQLPSQPKPMVDQDALLMADPPGVRSLLGDGSGGGAYVHPDADMRAFWGVVVDEVRDLLENGWRP